MDYGTVNMEEGGGGDGEAAGGSTTAIQEQEDEVRKSFRILSFQYNFLLYGEQFVVTQK